ncbi:serine/threonine-protein kinase HT1-like protein [Tanacetum coccineum]
MDSRSAPSSPKTPHAKLGYVGYKSKELGIQSDKGLILKADILDFKMQLDKKLAKVVFKKSEIEEEWEIDLKDGSHTIAEILAFRKSFSQEVEVWQKLDHLNVTKFISASMGTSELNVPSDEGQNCLRDGSCCVVVEYVLGAQNPKDMTGKTGTLAYMAPEVHIMFLPFRVTFNYSIIG